MSIYNKQVGSVITFQPEDGVNDKIKTQNQKSTTGERGDRKETAHVAA